MLQAAAALHTKHHFRVHSHGAELADSHTIAGGSEDGAAEQRLLGSACFIVCPQRDGLDSCKVTLYQQNHMISRLQLRPGGYMPDVSAARGKQLQRWHDSSSTWMLLKAPYRPSLIQ
jgi:hypothetical protein